MNNRFLSLVVILTCFPLWLVAQYVSGTVIDGQRSDPIPYVNIGVLHGQRGTVSNAQGYFRLNIEGLQEQDIIRFSFIGYEPREMSPGELERYQGGTIELEPKILDMQEVLVFPREFKERVVGNPNPARFIQAGFSDDSLGYELGILVRIKKRPTIIKALNLHGLVMSYDSVFYRINVYEIQQGKPGRNVLHHPIYFSLSQDELLETITIDLSEDQIVVQDDFVITLEYVKELGEGSLVFSAGFMNGKTYFRRTSQSTWHSAPIGIGMSTLIRYQK